MLGGELGPGNKRIRKGDPGISGLLNTVVAPQILKGRSPPFFYDVEKHQLYISKIVGREAVVDYRPTVLHFLPPSNAFRC